VYKWDFKQTKKQFMHTFKSHTKAITSLKRCHTNENYVVTASLDGTIKMWCLEKMIEIYSFNVVESGDGGLGDQMESILLIDDRLYAIFLKGYSNAIKIGQISHLATSFFISKPIIEQASKGFLGWNQKS
jgi:WD40 repeat protein